MILQFDRETYHEQCQSVAERDAGLRAVLRQYGYPPYWVRPNTFATLVLTILEQQVSLAAALAAYNRLQARLGVVEPRTLLGLTDEELRACYFTRQKTGYVRGLAVAVLEGKVRLKAFEQMPDEAVRAQLKELKGIGDWTVDIYLLHALRRTDIFPLGDLALVKALQEVQGFDPGDKAAMLQWGEGMRPYRSLATLILWHQYLSRRKKAII